MKYIYSLLFIGFGISAVAQNTFYLSSLTNTAPAISDHYATTNDDRGGIAVTQNNVYYTGDSATGVFSLNFANKVKSAYLWDGLVCNISGNGGVYQMFDNGVAMQFGINGGGNLTEIKKLDPITLAPTGAPVTLSTPLSLNSFIGIFSGTGYFLIQDGSNVYKVDFATGVSSLLTSSFNDSDPALARNLCENGASWGVAEYNGSTYSISYVKNSTTIISVNVANSTIRQSFSFVNLGDMCSFVASPWTNKWYFHYEGNAQFGGTNETVGSADMTYTGSVPLNVGFVEFIGAQMNINSAKLNWKVEKDGNIKTFIIEKMNAHNEFYAIGEVKPNGTFYYSFIDNQATDSKNYYRVKAIENSGDEFYTTVVSTTNGFKPVRDITITPNPALDNINIYLGAVGSNCQLEVINNMGQILLTQTIEKDYASVNIQNLPTGLYHVRIHSDEYVASGKFNKK